MERPWEGECHRCGTASSIHIMSMLNTQLICMGCKDQETELPQYEKAVEADVKAYKERVAAQNKSTTDAMKAKAQWDQMRRGRWHDSLTDCYKETP